MAARLLLGEEAAVADAAGERKALLLRLDRELGRGEHVPDHVGPVELGVGAVAARCPAARARLRGELADAARGLAGAAQRRGGGRVGEPVLDRPRRAITLQVAADRLRVVGERLAAATSEQRERAERAATSCESSRRRGSARPARPRCAETISMLWPRGTSARSRHALDRGFLDAHHAVVRARQAAERAAEAERQRCRRSRRAARARAQRAGALLPQRAAGAHHPAPDAARRRSAGRRGSRAPARRAAPRAAAATSGWRLSISRISTPPRLWPTKQRGLLAREARQRLDVALRSGAAPAVGEDVRRVAARARAARASSAIAAPGIHSPGASTTSRFMRSCRRARRSRSRARCGRLVDQQVAVGEREARADALDLDRRLDPVADLAPRRRSRPRGAR